MAVSIAERMSQFLRLCYAIGLLIGTATHLMLDARYGVLLSGLQSQGYPSFIRYYWAALALLDPLCAIILLIRGRSGILLCLLIIVSDVIINTWTASRFGFNWGLPFQIAFMIFVVCTMRIAWGARKPFVIGTL